MDCRGSAANNALSTSATTAGATTSSVFTYNPLDQLSVRHARRAGPQSAGRRPTPTGREPNRPLRLEHDPGSEWCKAARSVVFNDTRSALDSAYDARYQRISLAIPSVGETTYDPAHNYKVAAIYVPTATGKEHQSLYSYDPSTV